MGYSIESSTIQDTPTVVENEPTIIKLRIDKNCSSEPSVVMKEFIELGIKESNLLTNRANITFIKINTLKPTMENNLTSEFGSAFLKDSCTIDGIVISIKDLREGYLSTY